MLINDFIGFNSRLLSVIVIENRSYMRRIQHKATRKRTNRTVWLTKSFHIKVTGLIVGNFERNPWKVPKSHLVGVARIHFQPEEEPILKQTVVPMFNFSFRRNTLKGTRGNLRVTTLDFNTLSGFKPRFFLWTLKGTTITPVTFIWRSPLPEVFPQV